MNFFDHQDRARRQTRRMIVLFAIAVVAIVVAIDGVLYVAMGVGNGRHAQDAGAAMAGISVVVLLVIGLGSLYRVASLRGGGAVVARQLGGVQIETDTANFAYRRLRNVVEEMSIAAGVPVPEIFVLEEESGINAFASGYAPTDAAITVTRGAIDKLTREELQGVIGHEFSHVLNGDMRLNIRLMGIVFGILVIATIGRKLAELSGRSRGRDSGGMVLFGLAVFAVGYIGVVFGRVIKASVSRQREFLADASAVQFTRQTDGIAGALKKIGGLAEGSKLASSDTEEVAHMLFGDGVGYSALFATHPPLIERIQRMVPSFRAEEFDAIASAWSRPVRVGPEESERADVSIGGFAPMGLRSFGIAADVAMLPRADAQLRLSPTGVVSQVGHPGLDDRSAAAQINESIPQALREAAWQSGQAMPLIFALLLNDDLAVRELQLAVLDERYDSGTRALVQALATELRGLHPMLRLPLASLSFPALRRRPRPHLTVFMETLRALIDADRRVTLDEYCLAKLVGLQVMDSLRPAATQPMSSLKLPGLVAELKDLLAVVARYGHDDAAGAQRAYALGLREVLPDSAIDYSPPFDFVGALDRALPRLDHLAPAGKELVVRALTIAISADGVVSVAESELLRTVCAALHCPLPPMLQRAA
ncbi:MAG: M48 family metallopeptidase [Dokdonella sp.]|uniref:M48 family metallopeptidase n=1 Tax=Dokdonella sp. TaxID=2291710 RepID=UPI003263E434